MSFSRDARIYVVLSLTPLREGIGAPQVIVLTPEEMNIPSAQVVQQRLGASANLAEWEVKMRIKLEDAARDDEK